MLKEDILCYWNTFYTFYTTYQERHSMLLVKNDTLYNWTTLYMPFAIKDTICYLSRNTLDAFERHSMSCHQRHDTLLVMLTRQARRSLLPSRPRAPEAAGADVLTLLTLLTLLTH